MSGPSNGGMDFGFTYRSILLASEPGRRTAQLPALPSDDSEIRNDQEPQLGALAGRRSSRRRDRDFPAAINALAACHRK